MRKLFAVLLIFALAVSVSAQTPFVVDDGGLLNLTEAGELEKLCADYYDTYGFTVAVHTVETLEEKPAAAVAAEVYEAAGYGNDGALLLICEYEGQWYIYTSGLCARLISDEELTVIGQEILDDLQSDNYGKAIETFAKRCAEPVSKEMVNREQQSTKTQKTNNLYVVFGMVGGLVVGFMVALLFAVGKRERKKPQKRQKPAFPGEENTEI